MLCNSHSIFRKYPLECLDGGCGPREWSCCERGVALDFQVPQVRNAPTSRSGSHIWSYIRQSERTQLSSGYSPFERLYIILQCLSVSPPLHPVQFRPISNRYPRLSTDSTNIHQPLPSWSSEFDAHTARTPRSVANERTPLSSIASQRFEP